MAKPVEFEGQTQIFRSLSTNENEIGKIPVHFRMDGKEPGIITCWQLSREELEELKINGGKMYLLLKSQEMPPIAMSPKVMIKLDESDKIK